MHRRIDVLASFRVLPRDLRLVFLSLFLWTFGLGLYNYVWSIYLRDLSANANEVGLVFSIGYVAGALTMIPGGILANRYELRRLLILGWALSIPAPIMFFYARSWVEVIPGLILLQVSAFNLPALNAYITGTVDKQRISSAFGTVYSAAPLGLVVSPAVGGFLLTWFQIRDLFLFSLLFFTVSTILLFPVKRQPAQEADSSSPNVEFPKSSLEKTILVFLAGASVSFSIASPFLPLYFQDIVGLNKSQIQLLGAVQSLGAGVFAIALGKLAVGRSQGQTMALGLILAAVGLVGIGLTGSLMLVPLMVFLFGAARAPGPIAYSILSHARKNASRAGRFGLYLTADWMGFVPGSYVGGPLYTLSPIYVLTVPAISFLALAALSVVWIRKEHAPREHDEALASQAIQTTRSPDG